MVKQQFNLDTPLLHLRDNDGVTNWTIRDAVEGLQIFGGIGSGKSSGSGKTIALKYLSAGFGGLVLCCKADEAATWIRYAKQAGRSDDIVVIEQNGNHSFNWLEYESAHRVGGVSITQNVVQVLKTVLRARDEKNGGKSDDQFWEAALDLLITRLIELCQLAYGKISVRQLFDLVKALPKKGEGGKEEANTMVFTEAFNLAQSKVNDLTKEFMKGLSEKEKAALKDAKTYEAVIIEAIPEAATLKYVFEFFSAEYRNLSEKTRSIIEFSYTSFLAGLVQEPIYSHFCRYRSTVTPEDCLDGKIVIVNFPVKHYNKVGQDIQVMVKYIFQRAWERRNVTQNGRFCFLWADESQLFIHEYDAEWQATARSSRIATVYLSQNLANYNANMGGAKYQHRVTAFLGTLGTKIFHCNADHQTNVYASELIGQHWVIKQQRSKSFGQGFSMGTSEAPELQQIVRPEEFSTLLKGGPENDFFVEAYMHLQGKTFHTGASHRKIVFNQK